LVGREERVMMMRMRVRRGLRGERREGLADTVMRKRKRSKKKKSRRSVLLKQLRVQAMVLRRPGSANGGAAKTLRLRMETGQQLGQVLLSA